MKEYCTQEAWIAKELCGKTCAEHGFETDPNCCKNKYFCLVQD